MGNKGNRHCLWHVFDTKRKRVVAYTFGPRTDATCRWLLRLLSPFQIDFITSDGWGSYDRGAPAEKCLTRNMFTQWIERNSLTLRLGSSVRLARPSAALALSNYTRKRLAPLSSRITSNDWRHHPLSDYPITHGCCIIHKTLPY